MMRFKWKFSPIIWKVLQKPLLQNEIIKSPTKVSHSPETALREKEAADAQPGALLPGRPSLAVPPGWPGIGAGDRRGLAALWGGARGWGRGWGVIVSWGQSFSLGGPENTGDDGGAGYTTG